MPSRTSLARTDADQSDRLRELHTQASREHLRTASGEESHAVSGTADSEHGVQRLVRPDTATLSPRGSPTLGTPRRAGTHVQPQRQRSGDGEHGQAMGAVADSESDEHHDGEQGEEDDERMHTRIRVCVRKRPLGKRERRRGEQDVVDMEGTDTCCVVAPKVTVDMTQFNHRHEFVFDEVRAWASL